ncbi:MAG: CDP-alcohol phosphatidyltransferase family protein [Anaerolineae bacterium]|nr:CDP-alcohol phosphatidyltransferase family protein [Anaerolineae bacterium]
MDQNSIDHYEPNRNRSNQPSSRTEHIDRHWIIGYIKDIITSLGLLSAIAAILVLENHVLQRATVFFFLGMLCDLLDGFIARFTKTANEFGRYYDGICDFLLYSIASAVLLYVGLAAKAVEYSWFVLATYPIAGGIRFAIASTRPTRTKFDRTGLARAPAGILIVVFLNSTLFELTISTPTPFFLVLASTVLQLLPIQYPNRAGIHIRSMRLMIIVAILTIMASITVSVLTNQIFLVFDLCFLWILVWALISPLFLMVISSHR